jgi:hypothetical protein
MSSIIRVADTYRGISVFGRGVFTHDKWGGRTYAGTCKNGHACGLGVVTYSFGRKDYAKHGPDGQFDGRFLGRFAHGDTDCYRLFERGEGGGSPQSCPPTAPACTPAWPARRTIRACLR